MADTHAKHHDYHLVDPSPWPAVGANSSPVWWSTNDRVP